MRNPKQRRIATEFGFIETPLSIQKIKSPILSYRAFLTTQEPIKGLGC